MQKRTNLFIFVFICSLIWFRLFKESSSETSNLELLLVSLLYFICCMPLLLFLGTQKKNIPFVPIFTIFYFVNFGLGIFNDYAAFSLAGINRETIIRLLILAIGGIGSFMLAFYSPIFKLMESILPKIKLNWEPKSAYRLSIYISTIGMIASYYYQAYRLPLIAKTMVGFVANLSHLGIAILFLLFLQKQVRPRGKVFLWVIIGFRLLLDLSTGSTSHILVSLSLLFFIYFFYRQRIPWLTVVIVMLFFVFIFGVRDEFRSLTWYGKYYDKSPAQKASLYVQLIKKRMLQGSDDRMLAEDYKRLSSRANILITFARVTELTPDYIPYWGGYTYRSIFTSGIPRFLLPDKPLKNIGQQFGHRYGFLNPFDKTTSYNLPVLVEMYVNFGAIGIIIGMAILGMMLKILYVLFNHDNIIEAEAILSACIFMPLLNLDSDFSLMFGNIIYYIILFYLTMKFSMTKPRKI